MAKYKVRQPEEFTIAQLLNPKRFPGMSGKMAAIVGLVLGEKFTDPYLEEMYLTVDDMVTCRKAGDIGANEFYGSKSDMDRNWYNLIAVAGLSKEQEKTANMMYEASFDRC